MCKMNEINTFPLRCVFWYRKDNGNGLINSREKITSSSFCFGSTSFACVLMWMCAMHIFISPTFFYQYSIRSRLQFSVIAFDISFHSFFRMNNFHTFIHCAPVRDVVVFSLSFFWWIYSFCWILFLKLALSILNRSSISKRVAVNYSFFLPGWI